MITTMIQGAKLIGWVTLVASPLIGQGSSARVGGTSMIAQYDVNIPSYTVGADVNIVDLIRSKSEATIKPFEQILSKLARSDKSACDIQAEIRLVAVSRSFGDGTVESSQTNQALEAVKSLYGIRKAICETGATGNRIPPVCRVLTVVNEMDLSHKALVKSEIDLSRTASMAACLTKLQDYHYFWTSYSNNLQDAGGIIQLIRSDVEMYNTLMTYRDFQTGLSDLANLLELMFANSTKRWTEAERRSTELFDTAGESMEQFSHTFKSTTSEILQDFEGLSSWLNDHHERLHEFSSKSSKELETTIMEMSAIGRGIGNMKVALADIYSNAASEIASLTKSQISSLDHLHNAVVMQNSLVSAEIREVEVTMLKVSDHAMQLLEIQELTFEHAQENLELMASAVVKQHESVDLLDYTLNIVNTLATDSRDLAESISTFTYLVGLVKQYEMLIASVLVYIALSIVLAPFDGLLLSSKTVSDLKGTYWILQAAIFLFRKLDFFHRLASAKHSAEALQRMFTVKRGYLFLLAICLISIVTIAVCYASLGRAALEGIDIEDAQIGFSESRVAKPHLSESHARRMRSIPARGTRYGTAPPGL